MDVVLLDTDVFSYLLMRPGEERAKVYQKHVQGRIAAVSFVTIGELYAGAVKKGWGEPRREALEQKLGLVVKVPFDYGICQVYGRLRYGCTNLDGSTRVIASNDLWIASCAIHHDIPLVSNNRKHFEGIPGLKLISEAPVVESLSAQRNLHD